MLHNTLQNFKALRCDVHHSECCSLVCIDEQCETSKLICPQCHSIEHVGHVIKPLTYFLSEVHRDLVQDSRITGIMAKFDQEHLKARRMCIQIVNRSDRDSVRQYIDTFYNDLSSRIQQYIREGSQLLSIDCPKLHEVNVFISQYRLYPRETEEDIKMSNYELYLREVLEFVCSQLGEFRQAIKNKDEIGQMMAIFSPFATESKIKYIFSESMKQTSINISEDGLVATQKNNYSTNFVFIEPALEGKRTLRSKRTIKLKIDKLMSWLSVGVAYLSFAKTANYYFNTGSIGHGGYLISNNGYSWHHSDSALNSFYEQWSYVQNDIVIVTVDPKRKMVIFDKENSQSPPYELPYKTINGQELYFCVSLSSHEEAVSIVQ